MKTSEAIVVAVVLLGIVLLARGPARAVGAVDPAGWGPAPGPGWVLAGDGWHPPWGG